MKYNIISYFLSEGFKNLFKNKKSTISCLGVMCATMFIFGLFFVIGKNVNNIIEGLERKLKEKEEEIKKSTRELGENK